MTAMKTMSKAPVLAAGLLLTVLAAPFAVAGSDGESSLDRAIAAQHALLEKTSGATERAAALNDLANLLELRGDLQGAAENYRAAIAADDSLASVHYNLALLAWTTGASDLARTHLEAAVERDPRSAWAHYQLGRLSADEGDPVAAVEHYVRALSLDSRLAFADINPHFAVNEHATEVLLKADRSRLEALPPRTYAQPGRISGLLLQRPEAPAERPAQAEASESDGRVDRGPAGESGGAGASRVSSSGHEVSGHEASGRPADAASAVGAAFPADVVGNARPGDQAASASARSTASATAPAGDPPRSARSERVFTRDDLRTRSFGGGRTIIGTPSNPAPAASPASGFGGGIDAGRAVGPSGVGSPTPAAGGGRRGVSGGGFRPSVQSSARLRTTIRRLPVPTPAP